jgi:hypothetical protein
LPKGTENCWKWPENRLETGFQAECGFAGENFDCSPIKPEGIAAFFNILLVLGSADPDIGIGADPFCDKERTLLAIGNITGAAVLSPARARTAEKSVPVRLFIIPTDPLFRCYHSTDADKADAINNVKVSFKRIIAKQSEYGAGSMLRHQSII